MLSYDVLNKDDLYSGIGLGRINLDNLKKIVKRTLPKMLLNTGN